MSEKLLKEYDKLIYKISNYFYGINKEDLIQSGYLGLIKAYKNFNKNKGVKFSTYAYQYIYGEMYDAYSKNRDIKINKKNLKVYRELMSAKEKLSQKYGREVSLYETCKYLKLDVNDIRDILNSVVIPKSIENDLVIVPYEEDLDSKILIDESIEGLNPLEKAVIENRYKNDYTQEETASRVGLSQAKVSRIESRSKVKIRNFIAS